MGNDAKYPLLQQPHRILGADEGGSLIVDTFQLAKAGGIYSARAAVWFLLVLWSDKGNSTGSYGGFAFG